MVSPASGAYLTLLNDAWKQRTGRDKAVAPAGRAAAAVADRDRDVEADGRGAGLAGQAPGLEGSAGGGAPTARAGARSGTPSGGRSSSATPTPSSRTPGLLAVLAAAYAGAGKTRGLTAGRRGQQEGARRSSPRSRRASSTTASRPGSSPTRCWRAGPATCRRRCCTRTWWSSPTPRPPAAGMPVVAIYPREGTFWCDHPIRSWTPTGWARPSARRPRRCWRSCAPARRRSARWRSASARPIRRSPVGAPIDAAHGADPKQPQTLLEVPDAATLAKLLDVWTREQEPDRRGPGVRQVGQHAGAAAGRGQAGRARVHRAPAAQRRGDAAVLRQPGLPAVRAGEAWARRRPSCSTRIDGTFAAGRHRAVRRPSPAAYAEVEARAAQRPRGGSTPWW